MEFREFKGKTIEDAITQAAIELGAASTDLETEVIEKGSTGFLGIGSKPAVIRARVKNDLARDTKEYLENIFKAMDIESEIDIKYDKDAETMDIDVEGPEM